MTIESAFDMHFTNLPGGPCPACGVSGNLIHHFGTYQADGNGIRVINHEGAPQGQLCQLPVEEGFLFVEDGRWGYRQREKS